MQTSWIHLLKKPQAIKWDLAECLQLLTAIANILDSLSRKPQQAIKWDLAECLERLAANANVVGSIPASSDTVEFWRMADEGGFE